MAHVMLCSVVRCYGDMASTLGRLDWVPDLGPRVGWACDNMIDEARHRGRGRGKDTLDENKEKGK